MNDFKICGIVLLSVILCCIFKNLKQEFSIFIRLGITILISTVSFTLIHPVITYIEKISQGTAMQTYFPVLIKILGIAVIAELTMDSCIDMGETGIANKVAIFAKAEILILTLPLITALLDMCLELL